MVDDEIRKVGEDIRALARSLAKDLRQAVDHAWDSSHPTSEAFKHELRGIAKEFKHGVRSNFRYGRPPGCGPWRPPSPPGPGGPAGTGGSPGSGGPSGPYGPYGPPWGRPPWTPRPPRPPRYHRSRSPLPPVRRKWDATTIVGILAVLFGVAWLLSAVHALHVSVEAVVAIGLMLLGAGLVVTGRTDWSLSRRSWPVWLGFGMIAVLIVTSSTFGVGTAISHMSFGNTSASPAGTSTVYGGFGNLTVHADRLADGGTLTIKSVAGNTSIDRLPASYEVNAHMSGGRICVNGRKVADGVGVSYNHLVGQGPPALFLDIHQTFGQVVVGPGGCGNG